jgi:hypothetical protein
MKKANAKNLVLWFGNQLLGRECGIPSRSRRSNFPFLGMKKDNARNLVWFGNKLLERVVDSFSQLPRNKREDERNLNCLVWKPSIKVCGRFPDVAALKLSAPKDEQRRCKKSDFFGLETPTLREDDGFLLPEGALTFRS